MLRLFRRACLVTLVADATLPLAGMSTAAAAGTDAALITQIYPHGGEPGEPFRNDYVGIVNRGPARTDLSLLLERPDGATALVPVSLPATYTWNICLGS